MKAIIAGSGLTKIERFDQVRRLIVRTPFGDPSCAFTIGQINNKEVVFLNRHGYGHTIAPHEINYQANIWALQSLGVTDICAIGSVGSMSEALTPGEIAIPDDFIDYTTGRKTTFFGGDSPVVYCDMSEPFDLKIQASLKDAAADINLQIQKNQVYACTSGPRLETKAEVKRMKNDGATCVGMTLVPEVVLAREANINYAALAICTNFASGINTQNENNVPDWEQLRSMTLVKAQDILLRWLAQ